jgi:hypothetical protein
VKGTNEEKLGEAASTKFSAEQIWAPVRLAKPAAAEQGSEGEDKAAV